MLVAAAAGAATLMQIAAASRASRDGDDWIDAARDSGAAPDVDDVDLGFSDAADVPSTRPIYRYSVIPGGAYDARELRSAVDRDPVVAAEYGGVAGRGVHPEVLPADMLAYMSYRVGNKIYWTKHQVRLRRGETILTDGATQLRGRCGNGISLEPALPTAESDPGPLDLDALVAPRTPLLPADSLPGEHLAPGLLAATLLPGDAMGSFIAPVGLVGASSHSGLEQRPDVPSGPPPENPPASGDNSDAPGVPLPPVIPIILPPPTGNDRGISEVIIGIPGGLDSVTDGPTGPEIHDTPPPGGPPDGHPPDTEPIAPVPTPEPGTLLLLGGGLAGLAARRLRARR